MKRILTHNIYRSADQYPDHLAFKQLNQAINYQQLVAKANRLANFLISLGVKKGDRLGIFMNRSFESSFSTYGIMLAGAAYVPLDSTLPIHRIRALIADCGIQIVISKKELKEKVRQVCQEALPLKYVIGLDEHPSATIRSFSWEEIMSHKKSNPPVEVNESDLAYIIYTSGTTGKSKGIVHTHYSGFSYAKLSAELYNITDRDILGNHSHLHYDISTMGYLTMSYAGGCTIIIPEAHTLFPVSLGQLIETEKISIWYSVPLALIQLLESGAIESRDWSRLRWILFGGEPFARKHIEALIALLPHVTFSNVYGPAEVNQCTFYNFNKTTSIDDVIPIGKAWPETRIQIAYADGTDPDGQVGELLVHSSTQMKGYWNQPELTESSLVPFEDEIGAEKFFYKTGDLVRELPNGDMVFVGRADRQIKVRGYRVELNEIESVLLSHTSISEAAVFAKKDEDVWAIFAGVVVPDKSLDNSEINTYLSKFLPAHALPSEIHIIDSIPRTSAGKIDYKSLMK